ncbi:MAG: pseudouridine synthase [Pirellulaceae bacterium]|nr:pseudouridine synthase [Pirellulaceae bacterium]
MKRPRPTQKPASSPSNILSGEQRINKLLAAAGLGSRRQVDELIEQGRVEIDGVICDQLGMKVDADVSKILVDGTALKKFRPVYYALNKPSGVLCTNRDPQGRRRAVDFIPGHQRLFPVGRLDASSVGLLLLTNDGELTQQLTHPKHGVPKTYYVVVAGHMEADEIRRLRRGIYLSDGVARVDFVKIRNLRKSSTELEITLSEGKNREIRRVLARIGHKVVSLRRLSIGPLKLANMPEGAYRPLTKEEIAGLYRAAEDARKARKIRKKENKAHDQKMEEIHSAKKAANPSLEQNDEDQDTLASPAAPSRKPKSKKATPNKSTNRNEASPQRESSAPRDPFAWDDDDELLSASPFAADYRSAASDEADDDEDGWVNQRGIDSEDDFSAESEMNGEATLIDDRDSMRVGGVLDYDNEDDQSKRPAPARKKPGTSDHRRTAKKSGKKTTRSFDQTRESKASPKTGKKKFGSSKPPRKGGFKQGGTKKGGLRKAVLNRKGRSGKGSPTKSTSRTKRRS